MYHWGLFLASYLSSILKTTGLGSILESVGEDKKYGTAGLTFGLQTITTLLSECLFPALLVIQTLGLVTSKMFLVPALKMLSAAVVWWMGVDYELFCATLCTRSVLLAIHSLGYILMI